MRENSVSMRARWIRLVDTFAKYGISVELDERFAYPNDTVFSISIKCATGTIVISDSSWRDHWTGYQGWVMQNNGSGADLALFHCEKARGPVVRQIVEYLRSAAA